MRYIEIDSIIEQIKAKHCDRCKHDERCALCDIDDALLMLEEADDADVEEVVRCKDCKEFHRSDDKLAQHCKFYGAMVQEDDFCSYGKRKEK